MTEKFLSFFESRALEFTSFVNGSLSNILAAVAILFFFWILYQLTSNIFKSVLKKARFSPSVIQMLVNNIYKLLLITFALIMALSQLGFNVVTALAGLGIAGVIAGFSAQDVLSNIIAGFIIFWDKPFKVGQWITVAGQYGKVDDITLRSTRIQTRNNTFVVIPNKKVIDEVLVNHSRRGVTRLNAYIGIAYKENIDQARTALLEAVSKIEKVLKDPAPRVVVESLGDSSVNLIVFGWVADAEDETFTLYDMVEVCKKALDEAHIQIPFPHRQVFIEENKKRD